MKFTLPLAVVLGVSLSDVADARAFHLPSKVLQAKHGANHKASHQQYYQEGNSQESGSMVSPGGPSISHARPQIKYGPRPGQMPPDWQEGDDWVAPAGPSYYTPPSYYPPPSYFDIPPPHLRPTYPTYPTPYQPPQPVWSPEGYHDVQPRDWTPESNNPSTEGGFTYHDVQPRDWVPEGQDPSTAAWYNRGRPIEPAYNTMPGGYVHNPQDEYYNSNPYPGGYVATHETDPNSQEHQEEEEKKEEEVVVREHMDGDPNAPDGHPEGIHPQDDGEEGVNVNNNEDLGQA